jgi:hypothetical protein
VNATFFEVEDGLICSDREYTDAEYVASTFGVEIRH